jgi:hypothetical protein
MSTEQMDERTRQLWGSAYLAAERLIEAERETERLRAVGNMPAVLHALSNERQARGILTDLVEHAGMADGAAWIVGGLDGRLIVALHGGTATVVIPGGDVDVCPQGPERLWDGRERRSANPSRLPLYNRYCVPGEVENVS